METTILSATIRLYQLVQHHTTSLFILSLWLCLPLPYHVFNAITFVCVPLCSIYFIFIFQNSFTMWERFEKLGNKKP